MCPRPDTSLRLPALTPAASSSQAGTLPKGLGWAPEAVVLTSGPANRVRSAAERRGPPSPIHRPPPQREATGARPRQGERPPSLPASIFPVRPPTDRAVAPTGYCATQRREAEVAKRGAAEARASPSRRTAVGTRGRGLGACGSQPDPIAPPPPRAATPEHPGAGPSCAPPAPPSFRTDSHPRMSRYGHTARCGRDAGAVAGQPERSVVRAAARSHLAVRLGRGPRPELCRRAPSGRVGPAGGRQGSEPGGAHDRGPQW